MRLEWQVIPHQSMAYWQSLCLRDEVLRKPLNLLFDPADLEKEASDYHIVGFYDGLVVACCILSKVEQDTALKMRQVAVSQLFQRRGLGKQMVEFCENLSRNLGIGKMVLNARESALPFYLALGYVVEGQEFVEVGLPHRRMWKLVDSNLSA
jgi:predicted GNAT family N-acyltransferase